MQSQIKRNSDPIAGYRIRECLGAGGYGEVWKAEAPGGLMKAIKFVYGRHDDHRATNELKSLERIKAVRHPFLLSLERIEVLEGQLVIVTELAEASLRDRFNACRQEGLPGIPRDELLLYVRDAAEALDFMSEHHSLQHLDVKAENLLLLSGRVKVADFGLVKDFRHVTASLMGGLTPLYAAPEVFRGSPSRCSDQYSLALVYQEMLTGVPSFRAESPAELTLRHLNDAPDLSALPESDRPVIARALAKEPANRFPSCVAMVAALVHAGPAGSTARDVVQSHGASISSDARSGTGSDPAHDSAGVVRTLACEEFGALAGSPEAVGSLELPELPNPDSADLGPIELPETSRPAVPTLFLGIGGTGSRVLRHLRRRFNERFGEHTSLPATSMLLLDTDSQSLNEATRSSDRSALAPHELLELPLKRPQQYRAESTKLLRWLSRRWLYNIPRSLKTEGLRPLGRLALIDHAPRVLERIRQAILQVTDPGAIAKSAEQTGLEFQRDAIRVYIVCSISGGTGSGMVLDIAYAVRTILGELGLANAEVLGILTHSTGTNPRYREVSIVNAFSWLTEYNTFHRPGGTYPGEESCGLPAFESGRPAFEHAYLVHLGDGLTEEDLAEETEAVADYVYQDSLTAVGAFLEACRKEWYEPPAPLAGQARLRTFGVHRISCLQRDVAESAVRELCRQVLVEWSGADQNKAPARGGVNRALSLVGDVPQAEPILAEAAELTATLGIHTSGLTDETRSLINLEMGGEPMRYFERIVADLSAARIICCADAVRAIDRLFGLGSQREKETELPSEVLNRPLQELIGASVTRLVTDLRNWIVRQLDRPQVRVRGAKSVVQWLAQHLRFLEDEVHRLSGTVREKRAALVASAKLQEANIASKVQPLYKYLLLALDEAASRSALGLICYMSTELRSVMQQLVEVDVELERMINMFGDSSRAARSEDVANSPGDMVYALRSALEETLRGARSNMALQVNEIMRSDYLDKQGGMYEAIRRSAADLLGAVRMASRQVVQETVGQTELLGRLLPARAGSTTESGRFQGSLQRAMPKYCRFGGAKRLVVAIPEAAAAGPFAERLGHELRDSATIVIGQPNELTLCYELAGLSLAHVAVGIINSRCDFAQLAARAHTRCDVMWAALTGRSLAAKQVEVPSPAAAIPVPGEDWAMGAAAPECRV